MERCFFSSFGFAQTTSVYVRVIITTLSRSHMGYNPILNWGEAEANLTVRLKRNVINAHTPLRTLILWQAGIYGEYRIPI